VLCETKEVFANGKWVAFVGRIWVAVSYIACHIVPTWVQ
jgi:hypothetical protein